MVEAGSQKLHRISFEEIQIELRTNSQLRAALIRYLSQRHGKEVAGHFKIVPLRGKSGKK